MPPLVVFAGLPGSGKSLLAGLTADRLALTYLRIDTVEAAIAWSLTPVGDSPVGYVTAEWIAAEQLRGGRGVVIDAVNNLEIARAPWPALADRAGARLSVVEVICGDQAEHRRRVQDRTSDLPGHQVPDWEQVSALTWEPISGPRLLIDNQGDPQGHVDRIADSIRSADRPSEVSGRAG